jgi:hypothetical protein
VLAVRALATVVLGAAQDWAHGPAAVLAVASVALPAVASAAVRVVPLALV